MYPKVQKYCLMSVKGCWTDFHIDLGGTSVWYHILKGKKTFFLIPPTDTNLKMYEQWVVSGKQSHTFFGEMVEACERITLEAGYTFFIPSGWIHAVYTPEDSLVFGGNFLHSFGMEKQLQIAHIEEVTRVPQKFRFPFFTEMLWYLLDRYVHCLYGRTHLDLPEEEKRRLKLEKGENIDTNAEFRKMAGITADEQGKTSSNMGPHIHLLQSELHGIKYVVMYLHHLPASKKNVPLMLPDPVSVIRDIRTLVLEHKDDNQDMAITGKYVLRWTESDDVDNAKRPRKSMPKMGASGATTNEPKRKPMNANKPANQTMTSTTPPSASSPTKPPKQSPNSNDKADRSPSKKAGSGNRRRRVRCKTCEACMGGDCKSCVYCKGKESLRLGEEKNLKSTFIFITDMTKYGGPGRMKQTCEKRRCLQPQLPGKSKLKTVIFGH